MDSASGMWGLSGRVAVVTGACGLLGREHADALAEAGASVVVADLRRGECETQAQALMEKHGGRALPTVADVTDKESVCSMVDRVLATYGRLDILINNAALNPKVEGTCDSTTATPFEDMALDDWNRSLAVDVTGMFLCAQAVARPMLLQGKGSIVNVSSIYGLVGPDQRLYLDADGHPASVKPVTYSVTKSAVLGLTRYLATYWAGKNIRVNALSPGGVWNGQDESFVARYSARTPMGRMARKDEFRGAVCFLASDASSYMTGANLVVDGGWTAW